MYGPSVLDSCDGVIYDFSQVLQRGKYRRKAAVLSLVCFSQHSAFRLFSQWLFPYFSRCSTRSENLP